MLKRLFDIAVVLISLPIVLPIAMGVAIAIVVTDGRTILYWSRRVGRNNVLFSMPKFRTMRRDTPAVATHLLVDPRSVLIPVGGVLRSSSLDELPQLISVLRGDMTFVGPRPALFNQDDLVELRTRYDVHRLTPGITGWAQINGRDDLSIAEKVVYEREYLERHTMAFDLKILWLTFRSVLTRSGVHH